MIVAAEIAEGTDEIGCGEPIGEPIKEDLSRVVGQERDAAS